VQTPFECVEARIDRIEALVHFVFEGLETAVNCFEATVNCFETVIYIGAH